MRMLFSRFRGSSRPHPAAVAAGVLASVLSVTLLVAVASPSEAATRRGVSLLVKASATGPIKVSGIVLNTPTGSPVLIQTRTASTPWTTVARTKTAKTGAYAVSAPRPSDLGATRWRANATRLVKRGKVYLHRNSHSVSISLPTAPGSTGPTPSPTVAPTGLRQVMFVGNNWDGTATIVDANTYTVLRKGINLIPDKDERLAAIQTDPEALAYYYLVRYGPGEGNDQYVDDMFTTNDGKLLAVSRPSFADVVWIDLAKALAGDPTMIVTRQPMDGHRSDHMGVSPDGTRLLVSDSTSRQVIEFKMGGAGDPDTGKRLRTFESGETPHENNYSPDGSKIYHASIGRVYLPGDAAAISGGTFDDYLLNPLGLPSGTIPGTNMLPPVKLGPANDAIKGDRWFEIVNNSDFSIFRRWDMAKELAEAGFDNMSGAVRPMAIAPDQRHLYFQVSFFHGIVEFDMDAPDINGTEDYTTGGGTSVPPGNPSTAIPEPRVGAVTRLIPLEKRTTAIPEQYVNDSAHHGLSISEDGTTLCAAGTMDDYIAMVDVATGEYTTLDQETTKSPSLPEGHYYGKPYWTTESLNNTCWASLSDADAVAVIDFATKKEIAYLDVGNHPQRVRLGLIPNAYLG